MSKKASFLLVFLSVFSVSFGQKAVDIPSLVSQMTLEEKVGQMTQLTLDYICKGEAFDENKPMELSLSRLDSVLRVYHVGSILNTGSYTLSRDKWYELIGKIHSVNSSVSRLKIPIIYGIDAIHGATYTQGSTLFPQELALAATWDPVYAEKAGAITAYEVRASAIPWNFSPVLDLGRQPLWSRFFETFGEDPHLATEMGKAIVRGYQGNNMAHPERVSACLKHYVGYSLPFNGKDRTPILMPERLLREYYLVPFQKAIQQGALTVMVNSSEINGTPVHADYHILTEILKGELGFKGFAVTDWEDIINLQKMHKVAPTYKDAIAMSINAGIDMSMVPSDVEFCRLLVELVKEGRVPMSRIDDAVSRILFVKQALGLFENTLYPKEYYGQFGSAAFSQVNYQAASEAITLLKNDGNMLPIKAKKVLVTGVAGNSLTPLNGAWTHTWQGRTDKYNPKDKQTIFQGLQAQLGKENVVFVEGTDYDKDINTSKAVEAAKNVDVIVVCLSEKPGTEKPGDINDLMVDKAQADLVQSLAKTGKPIVLVVAEARPRIITELLPLVKSFVLAYLPGNEGGRAIADILVGKINPSGRLPFTYPRSTGALMTYDHKFSETRDVKFGNEAFQPLFQFGDGLGYAPFSYSNLSVNQTKFTLKDSVQIKVDVKNTGSIAGKEVVKLFIRDDYATITPSVKRLRGFTKVTIQPGENKTITFNVAVSDLGFVTHANQWVVEPGSFTIMVDKMEKTFQVVP